MEEKEDDSTPFDQRWRAAQACDDEVARNELLCSIDFTRGAAQTARVLELAFEPPSTCGTGWQKLLKRASFGCAETVKQFAEYVRDTLNKDTRVKTLVFAATQERAQDLAHLVNGVALCTEDELDDYLDADEEPPHRVIVVWAPLRRHTWKTILDVGTELVLDAPWALERVYIDLADHVHGCTTIDYHARTMQYSGTASSNWGKYSPTARKFYFFSLPQEARTLDTHVMAATSLVCNQCTRGTNWAEDPAPDEDELPHWFCMPPPFLCEIAGRKIPREYKLALYLRMGCLSAMEIIGACDGKAPIFPSLEVWREMRDML